MVPWKTHYRRFPKRGKQRLDFRGGEGRGEGAEERAVLNKLINNKLRDVKQNDYENGY